MSMNRCFFVLLCIIFYSFSSISFAHTTGKTIEKNVGKYLIDVGYNPDPVVAGDSTYFDFKIYQREPAPGDAPYRNVWVRIFQDKTTLFATGIAHMETGATGMVYTFANPGVYSVSVRYETADETLGEVTFQVPVEASEEDMHASWLHYVVVAAGGFCLCAIVVLGWQKRKSFRRTT